VRKREVDFQIIVLSHNIPEKKPKITKSTKLKEKKEIFCPPTSVQGSAPHYGGWAKNKINLSGGKLPKNNFKSLSKHVWALKIKKITKYS